MLIVLAAAQQSRALLAYATSHSTAERHSQTHRVVKHHNSSAQLYTCCRVTIRKSYDRVPSFGDAWFQCIFLLAKGPLRACDTGAAGFQMICTVLRRSGGRFGGRWWSGPPGFGLVSLWRFCSTRPSRIIAVFPVCFPDRTVDCLCFPRLFSLHGVLDPSIWGNVHFICTSVAYPIFFFFEACGSALRLAVSAHGKQVLVSVQLTPAIALRMPAESTNLMHDFDCFRHAALPSCIGVSVDLVELWYWFDRVHIISLRIHGTPGRIHIPRMDFNELWVLFTE